MKFRRRQFLQLAGAAAAAPFVPRRAAALDYPARPVRIIVGFPPGGTTDIIARLMGQYLSGKLGQPFFIENRPGASGNIATDTVVRALPDGYTLLSVSTTDVVNAVLYDKLNFNFLRDIAPVAADISSPFVMVLNPTFPATSVPEFIAYAKGNPGKINIASAGNGTPSHVAAELFKMMAGVDMVHVPYRGEPPELTDLLGGQVQVCFGTVFGSIEYIRAGRLRALAVTTTTRLEALPDLPTVGKFLPGYEASGWAGIGAPKGTPTGIIDKLNKEINTGLADSKIKERIADLGATVLVNSPADFGKLIAEDTEKWGKVVKFARIKAD